ncbi:MAG: class II fructose-bisphosphate aldolase [Candidatus Sungbacteria bacterium]|nr:class II fructose-bisphosphate aldolase [Candidatus Sungbacteria bacterium]
MSLNEYLKQATDNGWAIGHFNASELDQMRSILDACKDASSPAMIGTSEGESKHLGLAEAVALRDAFRIKYGIPVFLNADHHKSAEAAIKAIDAGYDSVHIDLSSFPMEENIAGTKMVVDYARQRESRIKNQESRISVEGELGYLRGESKIHHEKIEVKPEDYTKVDQAKEFVARTGVDRLAIVIGNIHGIAPSHPHLDVQRVLDIRRAIPNSVALVLHGGSGIPDGEVEEVIGVGIANVHINTELRVAYVHGMKRGFELYPNEVSMYKLDQEAIKAMKLVVKEKLKLFGAVNKI